MIFASLGSVREDPTPKITPSLMRIVALLPGSPGALNTVALVMA